jgi:hypothetical protein
MCFVELCNIVPTSCDIESVGPQVMARATIILAIIGSNNPEALSPEYVYMKLLLNVNYTLTRFAFAPVV